MYVAKLNPDPEISEDEAIHEAIWEAMLAGDVTADFGRFWIVEGYILIDKASE